MSSGVAPGRVSECPVLSLGPDRIIEVGYNQRQKEGEQVAGDTIRLRRIPEEERAIVVLSDGLGSGVKASVLSMLTSTMALQYASSDIEPSRVAGIIMRTLPECSVRKIRYATFTALDLSTSGRCSIVNYDNPGPFLVDRQECRELDLATLEVPGGAGGRTTAESGEVAITLGQYLVLLSDGVTQSGMGSAVFPFGWGNDGVKSFLRKLVTEDPGISARELAARVVNQAASHDGFKPKDDISCAVVYLRRPRRTLVATGPPMDRERDGELAQLVSAFPGRRIIAGGTTANLIARELGREVRVNLGNLDPEIPPMSSMEGADLVTEGTITMSRVAELLEGDELLGRLRQNGATRAAQALLESDEIQVIVGTRINEAHQNPTVPVELEIRRNLMKRICRVLEDRYLKRTQIQFV
ncbi:MAG: SpoIIE family protein phosphatase [Spirochaetaceae bacterium]